MSHDVSGEPIESATFARLRSEALDFARAVKSQRALPYADDDPAEQAARLSELIGDIEQLMSSLKPLRSMPGQRVSVRPFNWPLAWNSTPKVRLTRRAARAGVSPSGHVRSSQFPVRVNSPLRV
jgi:hypothetical protein